MTALPTIRSSKADTARHPLSDGRRAAGRATTEEAPGHASSVPLTIAGQVARGVLEAAAITAFIAFVLIWSVVLIGG